MKTEKDIDRFRAEIDQIDKKILELINRRLECAKLIGEAKAQGGIEVLDPAREFRLIKGLCDLNEGPLSNSALQHVYTEIIAASRETQNPHKVAYLGPEATFTHIAAINHFGRSVFFVNQPSILDVFGEVEKGSAHFGVVPVENTIEGAVNYTLDLFYESTLKICAEIYLPISHDLLSNEHSYEDLQIIYSHPQAFAQCRQWLRKHLPDCVLSDSSSTAEAARRASTEKKSAAIASREAARIYDLDVLASQIEDRSRNVTRFLVIGNNEIKPTGTDKTSIMFVTAHVPGALYKVMTPISEAGINLVKLESRPSKHENWNYIFFVDMEGHISESAVKDTLEKMKPLCLFIRLLGSYPRVNETA